MDTFTFEPIDSKSLIIVSTSLTLGKFDKNAQIEQIDLSPPSIQGETTDMFRSKGFKITPEFREQVIKKGIPTYALPPVIGYGALNSMGENENGDQM